MRGKGNAGEYRRRGLQPRPHERISSFVWCFPFALYLAKITDEDTQDNKKDIHTRVRKS